MTDPGRAAVLVDVSFESLTGRPYKLYALLDPALSNTGDDDTGKTEGRTLVARDEQARFGAGGRARPDAGVERLHGSERRLDGPARRLPDGLGLCARAGEGQRRPDRGAAADRGARPPARHARARVRRLRAAAGTTRAALAGGFERAADRYAAGWHAYLGGLERPRSAAGHTTLYDVSAMVLAALEDKTYPRRAASPRRRWPGSGARSRATPAPTTSCGRATSTRWRRRRSRPVTARRPGARSTTCGSASRSRRLPPAEQQPRRLPALGQPAARRGRRPDPARLAARTRRRGDLEPRRACRELHPRARARPRRSGGRTAWTGTRRRRSPPRSPRWSAPPRSRSATARAPTAAELPRDRRRAGSARVAGWTRTRNGPLSSKPYYLRLTTDGKADAGTTYTISDGGPTIDQRRVVDASFLELVRLGVKPADDRDIRSTLPSSTASSG